VKINLAKLYLFICFTFHKLDKEMIVNIQNRSRCFFRKLKSLKLKSSKFIETTTTQPLKDEVLQSRHFPQNFFFFFLHLFYIGYILGAGSSATNLLVRMGIMNKKFNIFKGEIIQHVLLHDFRKLKT